MKIDILGASYEVIKTKYGSEPAFKKRKINGYCDTLLRQIVCCEMATHKGWEKVSKKDCQYQEQLTLRHEIVHAFLYESGLCVNSMQYEKGWATNEEMVDWIAIQGSKIYAAWQAAGAAQEMRSGQECCPNHTGIQEMRSGTQSSPNLPAQEVQHE